MIFKQAHPPTSAEGNGEVASCDRLVMSEWVRHPYQVLYGDGVVSAGVDQEGRLDLKDTYLKILIHTDSQPYVLITLAGKVCQFKALCLFLTTAPQVFKRVFILVLERDPSPLLSGF